MRRNGVRTAASRLLIVSVLSFLAAGSKESAWLLPLFALSLHGLRGVGLGRATPIWAGYALGIGVHLVLRRGVLGGWLNAPDVVVDPSDNPLVALDGVARWVSGLRVVGLNFVHLVLPWRMSPDYSGGTVDLSGGFFDPRLWAGSALLAGSAALLVRGYRRRDRDPGPALLVAGSWLLVSALFSMNLFLDLGTVLGDRLLFWPTAAWAWLLAGLWVSRPGSGRGRTGRVGIAALAIGYLVITAGYLPAWKNDGALFAAAVRAAPASPRIWYNHGRSLHDAGRLEEALAAYRRSRELDPEDYQAWAQEAAVLLQGRRYEEARAPLARALALNPGDAVSRANEGALWMGTGETERARDRFLEVLSRDPGQTEALMNLALAEGRLGRPEAAEARWREYLARLPGDPEALNSLAWLLATRLERPAEAEPLARAAVLASPGDPNYRDTLAEALFRQGKREEAARVAREALGLAPPPELETGLRRFLQPENAPP